MNHHYAAMAEQYYTFMGEKNASGLEKFLHPEVHFVGPLAKLEGKEGVLEASKNFFKIFKSLKVRSTFESGDQAMVVYDLDLSGEGVTFPSSALLTFAGEKISKIELFYDARPFVEKGKEIFS